MEPDRRTAIILGGLLIAAIVCGIFSSVLEIEEPDYLERLVATESRILLAVSAQAMMAVFYVAIAAVTYPIVEAHNRVLGVAYLMLRTIGASFLFVGIVTLLLFLPLGRSFAETGGDGVATLEILGHFLRLARDWLNHIGMVLPWSLGAVLLYLVFLRTSIVPLWLAAWGLAGSALTLVATILYMMDLIAVVTTAYIMLNVPTAVFEIVLAVYLIAKGFRRPVSAQVSPALS